MGTPSAEKIADRAFDLGLLDELQLQRLWAELGSRNVSSADFMQMLVRRELMTNYQLERLIKGERSGYFFGDYKVLYFMGAGTFARVYRAVHRETGQVVAVKVLRRKFSGNRSQFEPFVREGELGMTLRHPNIVPIYEVYSRDTAHFLVMEFVEGRNLREFVKIRKKIEPAEAVRLMSDIASGLHYAFEKGLGHRDLKMSNVLISSRGRAKVVDFGLATAGIEGKDDSGESNPRTIDYAALERATGVRKDDPRSDIYFMGCMFYHMLVGEPPLPEVKDRGRRLAKSRFTQVIPILERDPSLPSGVALIVSKAMSLDPEKRYQTPGAMVSDLAILEKRLSGEAAPEPEGGKREELAAAQSQARRTVMVVEASPAMQDMLRDGLKKAGFRVLVISNPQTALDRFRQESSAADCVVFNAQSVGRRALDTFNRFGDDRVMQTVPAVLLLDEKQHAWQQKAATADHRVVLPMPITLKTLREAIGRLVEPQAEPKAESGAEPQPPAES
jgi:serine/threonine-protein kinase